jgi:methionyl-tRNA formyltransferase
MGLVPKLNLVFMGTPVFAVTALRSLVEGGYTIKAVYSQPPRPAGRGHHLTRSPVHEYADSVGIPVYTPPTLRPGEAQEVFKSHGADMAVVAAYGLILPKEILEIPRWGCLNIHASILPRWRGAAPIQRAILAGDQETGITIMQMDEGLDTGKMLRVGALPMTSEMTAPELQERLSELGAQLILEAISLLTEGKIQGIPQPEEGVTYAHKLTKEEGRLDWQQSAVENLRKIRALYPWPGVYFTHQGTVLKVAAAEVVSRTGYPGEVLEGLTMACGQDALKITRIQKPGGKWLSAEEFLRGYPLERETIVT